MSVYVQASGLTLARGDRPLCENMVFRLTAGDCVHLAGANGSGKTSFMQAVCGLLVPEAGTVSWAPGCSAATHAHYCGHQNALKAVWTVKQNLRWFWRLAGSPRQGEAVDACLDELGLEALADQAVAQLSQGEQRRASLARLRLVPRPVWLLDEPFNALDAASQHVLASWMHRHVEEGGAVLFSSHASLPDGLVPGRRLTLDA